MKTPTMKNSKRERIDYLRTLPNGERRAAMHKIRGTAKRAAKPAAKKRKSK
jgi:hypothetical protein